jgi:hypothetical protein
LATGTDTRQPWALDLYAGSVLLVGALLINRLVTPIGAKGRRHLKLAAVVVLIIVGGAFWVLTGPAHLGWAARANHGP